MFSCTLDLDPHGTHTIPLPTRQCSNISGDIAIGEGWAGCVKSPFTVLGRKAASLHQVIAVFGSYEMLFILKNFCIRSVAKLPKDLFFSFCELMDHVIASSTCYWELSFHD